MIDSKTFISELDDELRNHILPWWLNKMTDQERGGYYGRIDGNDNLVKEAPKGSVLNARILWTYSAAFQHYRVSGYQVAAERAKNYILRYFIDKANGGAYWLLDYSGKPLDSKKQIYAQAFMIYGLSEYYKSFKDPEILNTAIDFYHAIEEHGFDPEKNGYFEAYDLTWNLLSDLRLSEKEINEKKTMNTHLHILEAYAALYRLWPDRGLRKQLVNLLELFFNNILDQSFHFRLFFNEDWESKSSKVSFGHDIEGSWLMCEAAESIGDPAIRHRAEEVALKMVDAIIKEGIGPDGSLYNETEHGQLDDDRHWWPQAELMVGLVNAYQLSGNSSYLEAAMRAWTYIKSTIIDKKNGEWFYRVSRDGLPYREEDKAGIWKCPYHNTRACLEVMNRLG